ncbi:MAG: DUF2156 domain-containing protein [Oscillospiraceae bacterium]|nr:DUF2156 domain-containing protein [Oscillospiraceae bacterium]
MEISFEIPSLAHKAAVQTILEAAGAMENDAAFANLYLLRRKYGTELAFRQNMLLRRYTEGFRAGCYGFPLGCGDLKAAVACLQADARARGIGLRMTLLTEEMCTLLEQVCPGAFSFTEAEGYDEYLYLREELAEMRGSRYHRKRNHMAQFWRQNPDGEIQPLIPENADLAVDVARQWLMARENPADPALQAEFSCICEAAAHMRALHMEGLLLYAGGKPIGMTMVSPIAGDVYDVHFEKVVPHQPHAWPVVANEMAKCLPHARYLNREEDLGESGMRAAKASYYPAMVRKKYIARLKESSLC